MNHWVFCPLDHIPSLLLPDSDLWRNSDHRFQFHRADMFSLPQLTVIKEPLSVTHRTLVVARDRAKSDETPVSGYREVHSSDRIFLPVWVRLALTLGTLIRFFCVNLMWATHERALIPSAELNNTSSLPAVPLLSVSHSFTGLSSSSILFHFLFLLLL